MAGQVKFILDAENAKAVNAFLKVVDSQKKTENSFRRSTKAGKGLDQTLGGMIKTGAGLATGFLGVASALQAVRSGFGLAVGIGRQYRESVTRIGQANVQLERTLRPLFALNENAFDTRAIRADVMATSTAYGQAAQSIADAEFLLQSAIGGLDASVQDAVRQQVRMLSLLGTDMPTAISGSASALLIYKKNLDQAAASGDSAAEAASRMVDQLVLAADMSKATQAQLLRFVPRSLQAGEARGFSIEETLSLLPTATAVSPSTEIATTAVANFMTRLAKAEEVLGIELSGSLQTQIGQIAEAVGGDMALLDKIFERELSNFVKTLFNSVDDVATAHARLESVTTGFSARKLGTIRTDPQSFIADVQGAADQALQNLPAFRAQDSTLLAESLRFRAAKIGAGLVTPGFEGVAEKLATFDQLAEFMGVDVGDLGGFEARGAKHLERQLRTGGNVAAADFLRVMFGEQFGIELDQGLRPVSELSFAERAVVMSRGDPRQRRFSGVNEAMLLAELQAAVSAGAPVPGMFAEAAADQRITPQEFQSSLPQMRVDPDSGERTYGGVAIEELIRETRDLVSAVRESTKAQNRAAARLDNAAERVPAGAATGGE